MTNSTPGLALLPRESFGVSFFVKQRIFSNQPVSSKRLGSLVASWIKKLEHLQEVIWIDIAIDRASAVLLVVAIGLLYIGLL